MRSCAKCREDIVAGQEFLNALDEDWHKECFVCNSCSKPFQGSFTMGDDGLPMHEDCFQKREKDKAKSCPICHGKLMPGEPILETGSGQEYHQRCFKCSKCKKTFEGNSFVMEGEKPYHLECATTDASVKNDITDESLATERCHGCGGQIESSRKIVPGLGHYHPKCFVCDTCRKSIAEKSYYVHPTSGEPTCDRCIQKYK